ncbi:winged helix-turn-helix domain-containing protein [Rhodobacterales bacterium HKCCE2091]|nr:winged helix-turn-helix domain-containing protein [Rhodobacterales bacterium HKCCE2091]
MSRPVIDNPTARALFLHRHGLGTPRAAEGRGRALRDLVTRLGFVQVDSVNTLARAHDMILYARARDYRPESLRRLNDRTRETFEGWTHDASVIPTPFFPVWRHKFRRDGARIEERWHKWQGSEYRDELDRVLAHVAERGTCRSSDLIAERPEKATGWWDWHPSKTALEYLWRTGRLAVTKRTGFEKHYDLAERVIPAEHHDAEIPEAEAIDWACNAAMDRLGIATPGEIAAFWGFVTPVEGRDWAARERAAGRLVEVAVELVDGSRRPMLIRPGDLDTLPGLPPVAPRLRVLSPFDPALRDRKRAERLFGFEYRIEIYVPEPKRRYGYYVFPVIEGARMIGRIDVSADRAAGRLALRGFWPEPGVAMGRGRLSRLDAELDRLARFAGCEGVDRAPGWLRES